MLCYVISNCSHNLSDFLSPATRRMATNELLLPPPPLTSLGLRKEQLNGQYDQFTTSNDLLAQKEQQRHEYEAERRCKTRVRTANMATSFGPTTTILAQLIVMNLLFVIAGRLQVPTARNKEFTGPGKSQVRGSFRVG